MDVVLTFCASWVACSINETEIPIRYIRDIESLYCLCFKIFHLEPVGKFTQLGRGIDMRSCVGRCCNTPLCDVAFMFSDKCYAVGCFNEADCQAVVAKPSALSPKLAYVSKNRGSSQPAITDGSFVPL